MFKPIDHSTLLQAMGDILKSHYLYDYYCASRERLCELSNTLSGYHFQNGIKNRLKNVLYFTTLNDREDRRDDEAFYFGLLCRSLLCRKPVSGGKMSPSIILP